MIEANRAFESHFKGPCTYQFSTKGSLDINWSERLAGMEINHFKSDSPPVSILTGNMIDQSKLFGLLNTLNDYPYTIISVNKIIH